MDHLLGPSLAARLSRREGLDWWLVDQADPEVGALERLAALWDHLERPDPSSGAVLDVSAVPEVAGLVSSQLTQALPDSLVLHAESRLGPYRGPHWRPGLQEPPSHDLGGPFRAAVVLPGLSTAATAFGCDILVQVDEDVDGSTWALRVDGPWLVVDARGAEVWRARLGSDGLAPLGGVLVRARSREEHAPLPGQERVFDALREALAVVGRGAPRLNQQRVLRRPITPLDHALTSDERALLEVAFLAVKLPLDAYLTGAFDPSWVVPSRGRDSWDLLAGFLHERLNPDQLEVLAALAAEASSSEGALFDGLGLLRMVQRFD